MFIVSGSNNYLSMTFDTSSSSYAYRDLL